MIEVVRSEDAQAEATGRNLRVGQAGTPNSGEGEGAPISPTWRTTTITHQVRTGGGRGWGEVGGRQAVSWEVGGRQAVQAAL